MCFLGRKGKKGERENTKNARENTSIIQPPCTDQIGRLVPRNADDKQPKNTPLITAVIKLPPYVFLPLPPAITSLSLTPFEVLLDNTDKTRPITGIGDKFRGYIHQLQWNGSHGKIKKDFYIDVKKNPFPKTVPTMGKFVASAPALLLTLLELEETIDPPDGVNPAPDGMAWMKVKDAESGVASGSVFLPFSFPLCLLPSSPLSTYVRRHCCCANSVFDMYAEHRPVVCFKSNLGVEGCKVLRGTFYEPTPGRRRQVCCVAKGE